MFHEIGVERRKLQKPDGLLELRGHRELLTQPELQRRFQHWPMFSMGVTASGAVASESEILAQVHLTDLRVGKDLFR